MNDEALVRTLIVAGSLGALLAFALGIWIGLGSPGLYDRNQRTGSAPRTSPWLWLLRGRQTRLSRFDALVREEERENEESGERGPEGGETPLQRDTPKPDFRRGRRFRR